MTLKIKDSNQLSVWQLLEKRVALSPEKEMLIDGYSGEILTFEQCKDKATQLAGGFYKLGIRPGDTVSWQFPTGAEAVIISLALARLGVIQNPILHLYLGREIANILQQANPRWILLPENAKNAALVGEIVDERQLDSRLELVTQAFYLDSAVMLPPAPTDRMARSWIYCTSGTTSGPKGALHTDRSIIAGGCGLGESMRTSSDDVGSIAYPYAHIGGAMYLAMVLVWGIPVVLLSRFVMEEAAKIFSRHGVTLAGGSTAHYQAWLALQRKMPGEPVVPTLRLLCGGGASKPPQIYFDIKAEMGVTVLHAYGMTESPLVAHNTLDSTDQHRANTDGRAVLGMEIRIEKPDGSQAVANEEGEILIRGDCLFSGYLDIQQTASAMSGSYYRTGDVGSLDEEGYLSITGRLKDIIIRKGENISALEVEEVLRKHDRVKEVAVIGLPDEERGERVCAVFEADSMPLSHQEMVDLLTEQGLMKQKWPEQMECVSQLPRSEALGKVSKQALREYFASKQP